MNDKEECGDKNPGPEESPEDYKGCNDPLRKIADFFEEIIGDNEPSQEEIEYINEWMEKRHISPERDRLRGRFIGPLIRMEHDLDKFLKIYFSTIEKEDEFQEVIIGEFTLGQKIDIFNRTVNTIIDESEDEDNLEEKKPNSILKEEIIKLRNIFAHDKIERRGPNTFGIKTEDGLKIIDEEYKREFDEKVKEAGKGIDFFYNYILEDLGKEKAVFKKDIENIVKEFRDIDEYDRKNMDQEDIEIPEMFKKILNDGTEEGD